MGLLTNLRRAAANLFGAQLTPPAAKGSSELKLTRSLASASVSETKERGVHQSAIDDVGYHIHQIEALNREGRIRPKPICTELESPVYKAAAQIVAKINKHKSINGWWRAFAQVSMGEMIAISRDTEKPMSRARAAFNSKRVHVIICDPDFLPVLAIEHQDWSN